MVKTRFYYLIEELDIDGDKQSDGFLISQYKLDRYKNKIFTKNKYVTFKDFKSYIATFNKNKIGGYSYNNHHNNNQIVTMTKTELNNLLNNQYKQPNYNHNQYHYQHPPYVTVQGNHGYHGHQGHHGNGFFDNLTSGLGLGAGFSIGDGMMDGLFGF